GIALNADSAGITLAGEEPGLTLAEAIASVAHFHISEVELAPIGAGSVSHDSFAAALRSVAYPHWTSVEMRPPPRETRRDILSRALRTAVETYS
ncbi:MAG TPA: hypothetical protein VM939_06330, partial [Gemmatimonadaceae bacterium]|nr:hypothetical protein [Gemmatimonadaceae bacterium]